MITINEYDIADAFSVIEQELISSMLRNMDRHRAEEVLENKEWSMWQSEQIKSLEQYKIQNQKKYNKRFQSINKQTSSLIEGARARGNMEQEIEILEAIKNGFKGCHKNSSPMTTQFFRLNDRKLEALIKATVNDMQKAETAILRMANDKYRKTIFNAQVYADSGAGTYAKAVDMATRDMLSAGLNCVEYKNGARHTLSEYADMAIRTASKRAYLQGEGEKRQEWGIPTVIINKRGNPCPKCLPFVGRILIDDVWSGGDTLDERYPLMSSAIAAGLYHPRCRDNHSTYFEGVSTPPNASFTRAEIANIEGENKKEQGQQYAKRQADKFRRLENNSLGTENIQRYRKKAEEWENKLDKGINSVTIESDSWSEEAIESRRRDEKIIAGNKKESAILYNSNGKRIFHKKGQEHAVSFTRQELQNMNGGVLTHNHPLGATFSETDIHMLKQSGLSEIRAVGRDGVYVLKRPEIWPDEINNLDKMKKAYKEIDFSLGKEMNQLYKDYPMSLERYNIIYQDRILKEFSQRFGLDYKLEVWNE